MRGVLISSRLVLHLFIVLTSLYFRSVSLEQGSQPPSDSVKVV